MKKTLDFENSRKPKKNYAKICNRHTHQCKENRELDETSSTDVGPKIDREMDWIHVFYPVRQQVSEQGSQRNKNVLSCSRTGFSTLLLFFILLKNVFIPLRTLLRNLLANRIKHMNSVLVTFVFIIDNDVNPNANMRAIL